MQHTAKNISTKFRCILIALICDKSSSPVQNFQVNNILFYRKSSEYSNGLFTGQTTMFALATMYDCLAYEKQENISFF